MLHNKAAMLSEYAVAQYNSQYVCSYFGDSEETIELIQRLRITRVPIRSTQHGWALQKGVPYWKSFNNIFGMFENSLFIKLVIIYHKLKFDF